MVKELTCKICNNSISNKEYILKEMMFGLREEFKYLECNNCQCLHIQEFPENMAKYYPENYYSIKEYDGRKFKGIKGKLKIWLYSHLMKGKGLTNKIMRLFAGENYYYVFEGLDINKRTKILDVGCGNGKDFLYPMAEAGYKEILGCDPYLKTEIYYENGLQIKNSSTEKIDGNWDIISYHHSFEHIEDPKKELKRVFELLATDGVCIIRVPTVSSYAWEHFRENWYQLDAPRHFFLHSISSMNIIAENANMELYNILFDSKHFQFSYSEKYRRDISLSEKDTLNQDNWIKRKIRKLQYTRKAKQLNKLGKGDQVVFFLRKNKLKVSYKSQRV
jgi:2-polyprenyl-3-methyl-5-hydroxy-6-metoxy-1,4-benzoquinol methylase